MPTSHKLTHKFWGNIGLVLLITTAILIPTLKWGGLLQASERKSNDAPVPWKAANLPHTPNYVSRGSLHKLQVSDLAAISELENQGARLLADYGSYKLFETDTTTARSFHDQNRGEIRDDDNLILLNAGIIDTTRIESQSLRRNSVKPSTSSVGMRLVQFVGAVKPEWHAALAETGVRIVTYIPNNAYLVYGDGIALANLSQWAANSDFVQWDGEYTANHRIDPKLALDAKQKAEAAAKGLSGKLLPQNSNYDHVILQMVTDTTPNQNTIAVIRQQLGVNSIVRNTTDLGYVNVVAKLPTGTSADDAIKSLGARPDVVSIQPYSMPVKLDERQNMIISGNLTGNNPNTGDWLAYLATNGFTQAQFTASNFAVNVSDSGIDNATTNPNHFALHLSGDLTLASRVIYNRLLGTPNAGSTLQGCDGHGNINAHIIAGFVPTGTVGGVNYGAAPHADASGFRYGLGVAPFVKVGSSVIFDPGTFTSPDYEDLESQAYNNGTRISSNSWGSSANSYTSDSQRYDALVRDAQPTGSTFPVAGNQENVILFAAGNNGSGANTVGSPSTGKNVITVGASEGVQAFGAADQCGVADSGADSANDIINFSSRGPTADGRKKPDIVAPGTHITGGVFQASAIQTGNGVAGACFDATGVCAGPGTSNFFPTGGQQFYTASSGTSHSTPAAAGAAALIRQRFINGGLSVPSPALTKAALMNSARYLTGTGANDTLYSNNQGMGEVNLGQFFDMQIGTVGTTATIIRDQDAGDMFTASGQSRTFTGTISTTSKPFRVVLAWTDTPGPTSGNAFVNNLDLEVTVGGNTYKGNVFSGANSATGGTADTRNNVESVFIPAGVSGSIVVTVKATNIAGDGVPNVGGTLDQDFALVVYNATQASVPIIAAGTSSITAESCTPLNNLLDPGENVTVSLPLSNVGTINTTNLVATLQATGGVTSPGAAQTYGALVAGGASVSQSFTFTVDPLLACGSTVTATLQLQDGASNLGTVTYTFQVGTTTTSNSATFSNTTAITIPASGTGASTGAPATPYPSDITVAGVTGTISGITVVINNFSHAFPDDVDMLLVGPGGQKFILVSDTGGSIGAVGVTWTITDSAASAFSDGALNPTGTYRPTNFTTGDLFPAPAPAAPYSAPAPAGSATLVSTFSPSSANGTWSLYVVDDASVDSGSIAGGWSISFTTSTPVCSTTCAAPTCTLTPPTVAPVANTPGQCSAVVNYSAPTSSGNCGTITCTPASGLSFPVGMTMVSCSATGGGSTSFAVVVQDTQAPSITCPGNQTAVSSNGNPVAVTYSAPSVSDNCPGVGAPTCSPASGSNFPVGTTTVTCTVDDASPDSPSASCSFTVSVSFCTLTSSNITVPNTTGQCSAVVNYTAPGTTGSCGTVTCTPASGIAYNVGTTTVSCTSSVGGGSTSFTVTVQDTQAPTIGACPANISVNGSGPTVVTYATPTASDNCPGSSVTCTPASGNSFVVGTTTVTCTASDASPNSSDATCTFTVTVTPCAITCPANVTAWTSTTSAAVSYAAPTTTGSCGTVTCTPASGSAFNVGTTTVTCSTNAGPSCSFTVTVNKLTEGASLADPLACAGPGDKLNGSFSATNTSGASANVVLTATLSNVVALPGMASADVAGTIVIAAGSVTWSGTLNAGQTVNVNWMGQAADNLPSGTQVCSTTTATVNGLPVAGQAQACITINCPTAGPGIPFPAAAEGSDQGAGSVLIYNIYTSGATSGNTQNTRVNLTNSHPSRPAFVHLFFVSEGCSVADSYVCLTGNQTTSFLASDLDPGVTGYLVAVAVDGVWGCPTSHNFLIGDEYVKFATGHAANLGAEAYSQLAGGLPACNGSSVTAQLDFNGIAYDRVSHVLADDSVGSKADGNDKLLILNRIGGNLGTGAGSLSSVFGIFYDDAENALSFTFSGGHQFRSSLSNNFPRITPRFETFIPAGRTGWFKVWPSTPGVLWGMSGATINFNPNSDSSSGAFNQGHNLHKLTLTNQASYTIPVFPPSC